jgi:hypothetical protein
MEALHPKAPANLI